MITIDLPSSQDGSLNEYGYVLLVALWMTFQCYMTGFVVVEYKRAKTYTEDYLKKHYWEEHHAAYPKDKMVPKFGYPDMGCGYYSSKLSYKQWFEFNIAQRIHQNFLEQIIIVVLLTLVAGLQYPALTVYLGIAYSVGRLINALGYSKKVAGRLPGLAIFNTSLFGLLILSLKTLWTLSNAPKI
ncbi:hypothetical protein FGO68_gene2738 [Halteria grandinella]|uniref:MAPEG family protein n=1 Tax=Halteria grandinella TaxID=5974 RepID=A0A8J8SYX6_HALGN|nr:hypothetical protein FGO68_gene2738 [Halteria grandinella]